MSQISDMQHAINRFFGNLIGSPIAEDGVVGPQTTDAVSAIVSGLPDVGYPTAATAIGQQFAAGNYLGVTAALNDIANEQNWLYDASSVQKAPTYASGSASPPRIAPTKAITTPGGLQASLNTVASTIGLPTWGLFLGLGGVAVVLMSRRQRKKSRR